MRPLLVLLALLCFTGCGRWVPGYIITEDGESLSNTDENMRATTIATIRRQLDAQLGGHWRTEVVIAELPVYESDDRNLSTGWMWPKATVAITLVGDGTVAPPLDEAAITTAVRDYLWSKVERPQRNLDVTTVRVVDVARFAPAPDPGTTTVGKDASPATGPRRYTAQHGDTWADLSMAFYGSSQHWRLIAEDNPGELAPGREVVIPARP
jgi:hypothetical protein